MLLDENKMITNDVTINLSKPMLRSGEIVKRVNEFEQWHYICIVRVCTHRKFVLWKRRFDRLRLMSTAEVAGSEGQLKFFIPISKCIRIGGDIGRRASILLEIFGTIASADLKPPKTVHSYPTRKRRRF